MSKGFEKFNYKMSSLKVDWRPLLKLEREFSKSYITQVGVLGQYNSRSTVVTTKKGKRVATKEKSQETNASIGLTHEYGSISQGIPQRSFLRMPLWLKFPQKLATIHKAMMDELEYAKGSIKRFYVNIGILAEQIIQEAFATRGFGTWRENSKITKIRKRSDSPLIDSGQLRRSIHSRVVEA